MATKIFVNLPVKNLDLSKSFFTGLGFGFNEQFTDDKAVCMVISDNIFAMLLSEPYFETFTRKKISNAKETTEVLITLDTESKEALQQMVAKAREMGGDIYAEPQDHGWMYQHGFADLDGHQWELAYMDESQMPGQD